MKHEKQTNGKRLHQRKVDFNLNTNIVSLEGCPYITSLKI